MAVTTKYTFSGHESFYCKSLWLKKGYDFVNNDGNFNNADAVVDLGVGKNMVAAIRYWMRAFGLLKDDKLTDEAKYLFDSEVGKDVYLEDVGTLWLLHYYLLKTDLASIYKMCFLDYHRVKGNEFFKEQLLLYVKKRCDEIDKSYLYNENTVKRDIGVMLQMYVSPQQGKVNEDFSSILIKLNLLRMNADKGYYFNEKGKVDVVPDIFLYAILDMFEGKEVIGFDRIMDLGLEFCMNKAELIDMLLLLVQRYPNNLSYTDDAGVRQLFVRNINKNDILDEYYK